MKNLINRALVAEKRLFFFFAAACLTAALYAGEVTYTVDDTSIFPNPERGFLHQRTRHANKDYHAVLGKDSELNLHADSDQVSLILVLYYLDEFNHTPTLPEGLLTAFDEDMQTLRNHGMKAIVRIAYAEDGYRKVIKPGDTVRTALDAPLDIIESHLAQYKQHWVDNADVIFCFQAGFVGQYGEWYYTDNFGNHVNHINDSCRALLDTALKAIPQNRTLLLRRPMFKMEYLDSVALTSAEAYTGTPKARLGHFNDAFLYDIDNMGTYSTNAAKRAAQKALIAQETLYVPLGGETDITKDSLAQIWATQEATVAEMSTMHWTFIKNTYSEVVTGMWRKNGTFDELNRNLGYRYQLVNATLPDEANAGGEVDITLNIKNVGYAPLYNERHAYLVFKNATDSFAVQLNTDPRRWLPNGVTTNIEETIEIPDDAPAGTYHLYLNLPDAYASLAHDPRYSVRFANEDMWIESNGLNDLNAEVEISSYVPPTPPTPVSIDTIALPGILNFENYADCIEGLTMYNTEFFDLGPTDASNLDNWVEWRVELKYPGEYSITEVSACPNSHQFALLLMNGYTIVTTDTLKKISTIHGADSTITHSAKWNLCSVPAGVYSLRVKNVTPWGRPKLKSLTLVYDGVIPSEDPIVLPDKLDKNNVVGYSANMTWYNTDYFDFGPTSGENLDRWAVWTVELKYPGEYIITEVFDVPADPNGHEWQITLRDACSVVSTFNTTREWKAGREREEPTKWNLSDVDAGVYELRVQNAFGHSQPKLKSLTLSYDGELPTGIDQIMEAADNRMYDILGRPVNDSYHGIIIMRGKKIIR